MNIATKTRVEKIEFYKKDIDEIIESHCYRNFIDKNTKVENVKVLPIGFPANMSIRFYYEEAWTTPEGIQIIRKISFDFPANLVMVFVKEKTLFTMDRAVSESVLWEVKNVVWNWENGAVGEDVVLTFDFEKISAG